VKRPGSRRDRTLEQAYEEQMLRQRFFGLIDRRVNDVGASRVELADRMGVSPGRVSQMLAGPDALSFRSVAMLSDALGIWIELEQRIVDSDYHAEPERASVGVVPDRPSLPKPAQPRLTSTIDQT
jgi:DNA-binding transcriptional regulator YdaS (Cro superfamily)